MTVTRRSLWLAAALLAVPAAPALAGPPDWAPAHGYRYKAHPHRVVRVVPAPYVFYSAPPVVAYRAPVRYAPPAPLVVAPVVPVYRARRPHYGVPGALAGAVAGAVVGSAVGRGEERVAAIAIGSVVGAVIGHEIGHSAY